MKTEENEEDTSFWYFVTKAIPRGLVRSFWDFIRTEDPFIKAMSWMLFLLVLGGSIAIYLDLHLLVIPITILTFLKVGHILWRANKRKRKRY